MDLTVETLLQIIGDKEVQLHVLRKELDAAKAKLAVLTPAGDPQEAAP